MASLFKTLRSLADSAGNGGWLPKRKRMAEATLKPGAQAPATPKAETPKVETKKLTLIAEMVALTLVELAKLGKTIVKMTEKIRRAKR